MRQLVRIIVFLSLVSLTVLAATGCGTDPDEEAVEQVFQDQLDALRNEDLDAVLATIHPESPEYAATRDNMAKVFELYDLEYDIEKTEVIELEENQAKVRVVRVTRNPGEASPEGATIKDARRTEIYEVRKTQGGWKIYKLAQTEAVEEL